ncbi:MAG: pilus assembly protein N-terminal domain-containing protein [Candidatus Eremiobacteraeota bacterium]|nr:pilus assembly protein N-terminal domain-containing protein [Candidatus Eremiobacteraeota bacterium]
MHHALRTIMTAAAAALIAATPLGAHAEATVPVTLRTGQSVSMSTPRLTRVAVGDGKIAGVLAVGNSEIVINGRSAGRTTLLVWMNGSRRTFDVTVTEQSLTSLRAMLQGAIPDRDVHVDAYDHSIVINGTVANGESLVHLGEVVAHFEPVAAAGKYVVVNAVTVAKPLGPLQNELAGAAATSGVRVDRDAKGNLIVSGQVEDRTTAEHVLRRVRTLAGPYLASDGKVIDRIETATISQVDVKVYVLEVDETALRQLGVNLQSATFRPDGTYTLGGPQFPVVESPFTGINKGAGPLTDGRGLTLGAFFRSITLAPTLNLIMQNGHARVLSSPDLVTMPGREANFLVGGQIPIPVATGPQQIAIQYKDFGVKLVVTPTILGEGNVETVIAPEVSDLDFQDGVSINGFTIPALRTSRLSTDVVTKAGESIVMGGLLRHQEQRTIDKIPLLGDLPILGKLFRSSRYQSSQTDVVFVMTPQILTR